MASLGPWLGGGRRGGQEAWLGSTGLWDPFDSGSTVFRPSTGDDVSAVAHAYVGWRQTDDAHIFQADIPGMRREEVRVHVEDGNILEISGERTKREEKAGDRWYRVGRQRGSFSRRFKLPGNARLDSVSCSMADGVLTVTVPKAEPGMAQKNIRSIDIA